MADRLIASANRQFFNEQALPKFISLLQTDATILDIGVSQAWGDYYASLFKSFSYKTLDRNPDVGADIVYDIEKNDSFFNMYDAIIAMGTWEQATNPFKMFDGIYNSLKVGGLALFGVVGLGYPQYKTDRFRFTDVGFNELLVGKYEVLDFNSIGGPIPEYYFYICRKKV